MQIASTPLKWTIPFAAGDSAKVEIPATSSNPGRFSLTLGSPPLTGQPPETGGVPPQLEDFNGAMNQIARIAWWFMGGGPFPYDATWATDSNVNGYANGAQIPTADGQGRWLSVADNNTANPDTVGTNWVPGYAYGTLSLTGQTGGTVTLTPAQAIKRTMSIAGTLTSALTVIVPAWLQEWVVTNTTTGAFTVTVKTAAGAGVVIPQDSSPTRVRGDGANVTQLAENIAAATQATHPMQFGQATGRLLNVQIFSTAGTFTYTPTAGAVTYEIELVGGGGGGGGASTTSTGQVAAGAGGGGGGYARKRGPVSAISGAPVAVGAGGTAAAGAAGGSGGTTAVGAVVSASGGQGGTLGPAITPTSLPQGGAQGGVGSNGDINGKGVKGDYGLPNTSPLGGGGGGSYFGGGADPSSGTSGGNTAVSFGSGGGGASLLASSGTAAAGGAGKNGLVIIREYT